MTIHIFQNQFYCHRTSGTFGFARHTSRPFAKPKEPLLCQPTRKLLQTKSKQINLGNAVAMGQILEFEVAFPGEEKLTIEQYLAGSSRELILNAAAFFLGFKNHKSKFDYNREFLGMFFRAENNELANQIYDRIKEFEKKAVRIGIINTYSSLKLFEYFFSRPEGPITQT
jgi:hypothetical protein